VSRVAGKAMCGIAGYSLSRSSGVDRTLAAQALLAAIAERGADAVGLAHRSPDGPVVVHKQRSGASAVLDRIAIPGDAHQVLLHVRDYTKGHPRIAANNHPVRHGAVVGVHNGTILNDDELMARHGFERAEPGMTVDSEVIFAVAEATHSRAHGFEEFRGSMAAAWLDEREGRLLFLARGTGRPLWIGTTRRELFFASTERALEIAEEYTGLRLRKRELAEGTLVALDGPRAVRREGFTPDPTYEADPLPAVRTPREGAFCLQRLAVLFATAS
jgi:glucosamine 6-phosphate synthetase-like amidotransferase/phosphosugar isomerase protein